MRLHYLQHVPFEDPAGILTWAKKRSDSVSSTLLFRGEVLPELDTFNFLVIMGGPMGVYDEERYPWLTDEKRFIEQALRREKTILGICLGAQLLADVLGAKVYRHSVKEIGWFPVRLTPPASRSAAFSALPGEFMAFHWHGDTFDIPAGCLHTAESDACSHQAFECQGRAFGLQFHLESTEESIQKLVTSCADELTGEDFIQAPSEMLPARRHLRAIAGHLRRLLDTIV